MKGNWKNFEKNAMEYLKKEIVLSGVSFVSLGGSNSTESDIGVKYRDKNLFLIEAKLSPSQSGQIVVLLENDNYVYSKKSKEPENDFVKKIIAYLNSNISLYRDCGTKGIKINIDNEVMAGWITEHYKIKGVKFIIVSNSPSDFDRTFIKVLPLSELGKNFEISLVLRRKRSGTRDMSKKFYLEVSELLKVKVGKNFKLKEDGNLRYYGGKITNSYLGDKFYIAHDKGEIYQVKKRAITNNPQAVFSLVYSGKKQTEGFDSLKKAIVSSISLLNGPKSL